MIFLLAILTLFLSGFFSGVEIAFVSSNRLRVELRKQQGSRRGRMLAGFFDKPSEFLGTTLVGNNLALVGFSILMATILEVVVTSWLPPQMGPEVVKFSSLLIITLISTIIVLIFGEFIPKLLFRLNPNRILYFLTYPLTLIKFILAPFVWIMVRLSYGLISLILKNDLEQNEKVFTRVDLGHFIRSYRPEREEEIDADLFENALYLPNLRVKECMIPRTEIIGIDIDEGVEVLKKTFLETGLSKIIIYKDSLEEILGYVHHHQMLRNPEKMEDIEILSIPFVPEVLQARELMNRFIKKRISIACVVDEFGGTAGICTLEDIVEEIVGEIEDEHDEEEHLEKVINHSEYLFSGRLEVDYLNEKYDLDIPEGEYHTLSGYIVTTMEDLPRQGEVIEIDGFEFIIESMSDTKLDTIRLKLVTDHSND